MILQIRLIDVDSVALVERKGSLTVVLPVEGQDDLLMRRAEDVRDWFELLQESFKREGSDQRLDKLAILKHGLKQEKELEEDISIRQRQIADKKLF